MLHFFEQRALLLFALGAVMFFSIWLPNVLSRRGSAPFLFVFGGMGVYWAFGSGSQIVEPRDLQMWEALSELAVTVSLFGAGVQIDRRSWPHRWKITRRLLFVAMPLTIAAIAGVAWGLGVGLAGAILLGACLAPTDPVVATDVQVGPPGEGEGEEDEVRFGLTSEAGFNDSLAFPFVYLAIELANRGTSDLGWVWQWVGTHVVFKLLLGTVCGLVAGWVLGNLVYRWPKDRPLAGRHHGCVAVAMVGAIYGLTEAVEGYGFLAVFIGGYVVRRVAYDHDYNETMHEFTQNTEHLLMAVVLILLGMMTPPLLAAHLDWAGVGLVAGLIFVIRPVSGMLSLVGSGLPWDERGALAYFGIRGLGSIYYVSYGLGMATFDQDMWIWAVIAATILASTVVHGLTATPIMKYIGPSSSREGESRGGASGREEE